jgi:rubrerythrin
MGKFKNYLVEDVKKKVLNELFIKYDGIIKLPPKERDIQIARLAIVAEIDAANLYESMATQVKNKDLKEILLDVAKEEKKHVGEFEFILEELDPNWDQLEDEGEEEAEEKIKEEIVKEASYAGNIGFEEMVMFYKKAESKDIKKMEEMIRKKSWSGIRMLFKKILGIDLKE